MKVYVETCQQHERTLEARWIGDIFSLWVSNLPTSNHFELDLSREEAAMLLKKLQEGDSSWTRKT